MFHTLAHFLSAIAFFAQLDIAANQTSSPTESRVDQILREWSDHSSKVRSLYTEFTRTSIDHAWKDRESAEGSARYLHPGVGRLDILGDNAETYIINSQGEIHEYKPWARQVNIYELDDWNDADRDLWMRHHWSALFLLFDRESAIAKYHFKIVDETEDTIRLKIKPLTPLDQKNLASVEVWLYRSRYLPAKVAIHQPNQNLVEYVFHGVWTNIEINPDDFVPKIPASKVGEPEWRMHRQNLTEVWNRWKQFFEERHDIAPAIGCG